MAAHADPAFVRRLLEETGVDQTVPVPSWSGYLEAVAEALVGWLRARVPALHELASLAKGLAPAVVVVAFIMILAILVALLRSVLRRRRPSAPAPVTVGAASPAPGVPERDRSGWRAEIERRVAAGDVTAALEALWWWFARSISIAGVDRSWTSQELLARCGRIDLAPLARALDRLLYGSERPTIDDVRRFLGRLEALLP